MKDFAAQQLSKRQMNGVQGGKKFDCFVQLGTAPAISGPVIANSSDHAAAELALVYKDIGCEVSIWCS